MLQIIVDRGEPNEKITGIAYYHNGEAVGPVTFCVDGERIDPTMTDDALDYINTLTKSEVNFREKTNKQIMRKDLRIVFWIISTIIFVSMLILFVS